MSKKTYKHDSPEPIVEVEKTETITEPVVEPVPDHDVTIFMKMNVMSRFGKLDVHKRYTVKSSLLADLSKQSYILVK